LSFKVDPKDRNPAMTVIKLTLEGAAGHQASGRTKELSGTNKPDGEWRKPKTAGNRMHSVSKGDNELREAREMADVGSPINSRSAPPGGS
jgi:hypothetical protein